MNSIVINAESYNTITIVTEDFTVTFTLCRNKYGTHNWCAFIEETGETICGNRECYSLFLNLLPEFGKKRRGQTKYLRRKYIGVKNGVLLLHFAEKIKLDMLYTNYWYECRRTNKVLELQERRKDILLEYSSI